MMRLETAIEVYRQCGAAVPIVGLVGELMVFLVSPPFGYGDSVGRLVGVVTAIEVVCPLFGSAVTFCSRL